VASMILVAASIAGAEASLIISGTLDSV